LDAQHHRADSVPLHTQRFSCPAKLLGRRVGQPEKALERLHREHGIARGRVRLREIVERQRVAVSFVREREVAHCLFEVSDLCGLVAQAEVIRLLCVRRADAHGSVHREHEERCEGSLQTSALSTRSILPLCRASKHDGA
jgi:hypothetical protein